MGVLLKRVGVGLIIGALVGTLIIGLGGRLAMRVIALMGGLSGGFSWGGTIEVVLLGLIIGAISGGLYGLVRNYFFSNQWLAGALFGLFVFLAILLLPIDGKGAAKGFPDLKIVVYLIFGVLHLAFGIVTAYFYESKSYKLKFGKNAKDMP